MDILDFVKRISTMSRDELMEEGYRLIARAQALDNKEKTMKLACRYRANSVPKNVTIREEYVKCKKPNCYRQLHGPYYYGYWKDPGTKRLKKRYIGRYYCTEDEQKGQGAEDYYTNNPF